MPPSPDVDGRADRAAQGTIGIVLLAGFVFRWWWVAPIVMVIAGLGALGGPPSNPLYWVYARTIGTRLAGSAIALDDQTARAQDAFIAILLALATLMYVAGVSIVGWLISVAVGIVAIIAATTGIHLGDRAIGRFRRRES